MASPTTSSNRGPHWRTVRTVTSSLQALIGPRPDPRDDRPLAGPEARVALPSFGGHQLHAPLVLAPAGPVPRPRPVSAAARPTAAVTRPLAEPRPITEPRRELPWWMVIVVLPAVAIAVAMMTVAP